MDPTFCIPNEARYKVTHKFVVDQFSSREGDKPINSIMFYFPDLTCFDVVLFPRNENLPGIENSSVIYVRHHGSSNHTSKSYLRCGISILNKSEEKCYTKEGQLVIKGRKMESDWIYCISRDYLMDPENGLLPDDTLTILCELTLMDEPKSSFEFIQQKHNTISSDLQSLFHTKKYSDVVLVSGVTEFPAHKLILSMRSPVFGAMFEHDLEEKKQNRVVITDIEPEVLGELLRYIYTGTVYALKHLSADLLIAADKYQIDSLKSICEESLSLGLTAESAMKFFVLSDMHNAPILKANCLRYIASHPSEVTTELYNAVTGARPELEFELFNAL